MTNDEAILVVPPRPAATVVLAASFATSDVVELAVVGDPTEAATRDLLAPVWGIWRPAQVLAVASEGAVTRSLVPLLADRGARRG